MKTKGGGNHQFYAGFALIFVLFFTTASAHAAVKYWRGEADSNFSNDANWSSSATSYSATSTPASTDIATFNGSGNTDCHINIPLDLQGINILSGFKAQLIQDSGNTINIGSSGFNQSDGFFVGSDSPINNLGNFSLIKGSFTSTQNTFSISGNWDTQTPAVGAFKHNGGSVQFILNADKIINVNRSELFNNFILTSNGNFNLLASSNDTLKTFGTLQLMSGSVIASGSSSFEVQGDIIIGSSYGINHNQPLNFAGSNLQHLSAFNLSIPFKGDINILKSGGTLQFLSSFTQLASRFFNLSQASIDLNSNTLTSGHFNYNSSIQTDLNGNLTVQGDFFQNAGILNLGNSSAVFSGKFTLEGGQFISSSQSISIAGNWNTKLAPSGSFIHNNGTVIFAPSANRTFTTNGTESFNHLQLAPFSNFNFTLSSGNKIKVLGNLLLNSGALIQSGTSNVEVYGNVNIGASYAANNNQSLTFTGSETQHLYLASDKDAFNGDITINKSDGELHLSSALILDAPGQDLIVNSGALALDGNNLSVIGTSSQFNVATNANLNLWGSEVLNLNSNLPTLANGSTVSYIGSGAQSIKNFNYANLKINSASGQFLAPSSTLNISENLILQSGTLDGNGTSISLAGNWVNIGGNFIANNSHVIFSGSQQSISGNNTFYHFTKISNAAASLSFAANSSQNILGTLRLNGSATQKLDLKSSLAGSSWKINASGNRDLAYLSVKDSQNISSQIMNCSNECSNLGNNKLWSFGIPSLEISTDALVMTEGESQTYSIQLGSAPTDEVLVSLHSSNSQLGVMPSPQSLSFNASNWFIPQSITVTAVDDKRYELSPSAYSITYSLSSNDNSYNTLNPSSTAVQVNDNDSPPQINISNAEALEGNVSNNSLLFKVSLSHPSDQSISVHYESHDNSAVAASDYLSQSGLLEFSAGETEKTISISIIADDLDEEDENFLLNLSQAQNASLGTSSAQGTILDDDEAPVVSLSDVTQNEGQNGSTAFVFAIQLSSVSAKTITIDYNTQDGTATSNSDYQLSQGSVVFNPGETFKNITVNVLGDSLDENDESFTLHLSNGLVATGNIINDDEAPTIQISPLSSNEGNDSNTLIQVRLSISAASEKIISVNYNTQDETALAGSDYISSSGLITFNPGELSKTIDLELLADKKVELDEHFSIHLSNALNASFFNSEATIEILNDDHAPSFASIEDKGTKANQMLWFNLNASDEDGDALRYYCNQNCPQGLSVDVNTGVVTWTPSEEQSGVYSSVSFIVLDEAENSNTQSCNLFVANILVSPSGTNTQVTEGADSDTYTIVLQSPPSSEVNIHLSVNEQATVSPNLLVYNSDNWNIPQTVTVSATDDYQQEGEHSAFIKHQVESSDLLYNEFTLNDLLVNITDNDEAGISILESGGSTLVSESGQSDSYNVVLTSQPSDSVSVSVLSLDQVYGVKVNQSFESPSLVTYLSFNRDNWNIPQTVTVTAVDDWKAEGLHQKTIRHQVSSEDIYYSQLNRKDLNVEVSDNDSAGISLSKLELQVSEEGMTDHYSVVLNTEPSTEVTVTLSASSPLQLSTNNSDLSSNLSLSFNAENWNTPQDVEVSAIQNEIYEGSRIRSIAHSVSSNDTDYNQIQLTSMTVYVEDKENRSAGISISTNEIALKQGESASYTIVLNSAPQNPVEIYIDEEDEHLSLSPSKIIFDETNWSVPQIIKVTALREDEEEEAHRKKGDHREFRKKEKRKKVHHRHRGCYKVFESKKDEEYFVEINHRVISEDALYNNLDLDSILVKISEAEKLKPLRLEIKGKEEAHIESTVPLKLDIDNSVQPINATWTIIKGEGSLSETSSDSTLFRAPKNNSDVVIRVRVIDSSGRSIEAEIKIEVWGEKQKSSGKNK